MILSIQALWLGADWQVPCPMPSLEPFVLKMPDDWTDSAMSYDNACVFGGVHTIDLWPRCFRSMSPINWGITL